MPTYLIFAICYVALGFLLVLAMSGPRSRFSFHADATWKDAVLVALIWPLVLLALLMAQ